MVNLWKMLSGYKTYLVCIAAIVTAIAGNVNGNLSAKEMVEAIFAALGGMALRNGIPPK